LVFFFAPFFPPFFGEAAFSSFFPPFFGEAPFFGVAVFFGEEAFFPGDLDFLVGDLDLAFLAGEGDLDLDFLAGEADFLEGDLDLDLDFSGERDLDLDLLISFFSVSSWICLYCSDKDLFPLVFILALL